MEDIILRQKSYSGEETLANKGGELTFEEMDNNIIGLLQRSYHVFPRGIMLPYVGLTDPDSFLICDGRSLGKSTSTADIKGDTYLPLFTDLWNTSVASTSSTGIIVKNNTGTIVTINGSGITAITAYNNNYTITIPDFTGKFPLGYSNSGLVAPILSTGGSDSAAINLTHTNNLAIASSGSHTHSNTLTIDPATHTHGATTTVNSTNISHTHTINHGHTLSDIAVKITPDGGGTVFVQKVPVDAIPAPVLTNDAYVSPTSIAAASLSSGSNNPSHTHTASTTVTGDGSHIHTADLEIDANGAHIHSVTGGISNHSTNINIINPYFSTNWIIKYV